MSVPHSYLLPTYLPTYLPDPHTQVRCSIEEPDNDPRRPFIEARGGGDVFAGPREDAAEDELSFGWFAQPQVCMRASLCMCPHTKFVQ